MALLTIGIGECRVSSDPSDVLVTHALGSCIAVVIHDPIAKVAGLLHYFLPESALDEEKAAKRPFLFADTGIPLLFRMASEAGGVKSRMTVTVVGGAQMLDPHGTFSIGTRNQSASRKNLRKSGLKIHREEMGGTHSRTVRIGVLDGKVRIRTAGSAEDAAKGV
ncbi:MAG: cheD [Acidobacteriaceae bacterium]|nr:cheD [Acidobacteriaceae bacterium]